MKITSEYDLGDLIIYHTKSFTSPRIGVIVGIKATSLHGVLYEVVDPNRVADNIINDFLTDENIIQVLKNLKTNYWNIPMKVKEGAL